MRTAPWELRVASWHSGYHTRAAGPGPACPRGESRLLGEAALTAEPWTGRQRGRRPRERSSPGGRLGGSGPRVELVGGSAEPLGLPPSPVLSSGGFDALWICTPLPSCLPWGGEPPGAWQGWRQGRPCCPWGQGQNLKARPVEQAPGDSLGWARWPWAGGYNIPGVGAVPTQ